jgi:RNA polymerase sigma factor (sigma-70 family)
MAAAPLSKVIRQLRGVVARQDTAGLTEADLWERYVQERDEAAFETLVRRHGPMVLGVCRRILRNEQDAEDAFQATFLVLVRNARSIHKRESLGSWLYGVAYRIARRAKGGRARRPVQDVDLPHIAAPESCPAWLVRDLRLVLDEEVNRLPPIYRVPFVLCHMEGKTNEQAARQLGCPVGTVLSRLARARGRLRARLTRRGLALSAAMWAIALAEGVAAAAVPAALMKTTAKAAIRFSGNKVGGPQDLSARVVALANGFMRSRLKIMVASAAGSLLGLGLVIIVLLFLLLHKQLGAGQDRRPPALTPRIEPAKIEDKVRLQGTWRVVACELGLQKMRPEDIQHLKAVFAGDNFYFVTPAGKNPECPFVCDETKEPKTITFRLPDGDVGPGIYQLDGDSLKLLTYKAGQPRPTDFTARRTPTMNLYLLEREQPAAPKPK